MESVFLRVGDGQDCTRTYPLSAFRYFTHNSRGHVYAVIGDRLWPVADCSSTGMACTLEEAIINDITATILEHRRLRTPKPPACILDLSVIAYCNHAELCLDEEEPPLRCPVCGERCYNLSGHDCPDPRDGGA